MIMLQIKQATPEDQVIWRRMTLDLWPEEEASDMDDLFLDIINDPLKTTLMAWARSEAVGLVYLSSRQDHVEGALTYPIGYIEGIYVVPSLRRSAVGQSLVVQAEIWCQKMGYHQLASDVEIGNDASQNFHGKMGFEEINRVICYCKKLK